MATLLAYSRLSGGSELTALRSIGVATHRFVVPALVIAGLMSGLTFLFNDLIVPPANRAAYVTMYKSIGRSIDSERGSNIIYPRYGYITHGPPQKKERLTQLFYAKEFIDGAMENVTLLDMSRYGKKQVLSVKQPPTTKIRAFGHSITDPSSPFRESPNQVQPRPVLRPIPIHLVQVQCKWLSFRKTPTA